MNLRKSIKKVLREETEVPLFVRRRISTEDLEWLVNDVKEMIDDGESLDTAIYDGVREFIKSRKFSDIDEFGLDAAYWESYLKYEKPLVRYVKSRLNIQESIGKTLTEESVIPSHIRRRVSPEGMENSFQEALDDISSRSKNVQSILYKAPYNIFAKVVIDDMVNHLEVLDKYGNTIYVDDDEAYAINIRKPLLRFYNDRLKERWNEIKEDINESVLMEENISFKKNLMDTLNEFGLRYTAKMLGISLAKVTELAKLPIGPDVANDILVEKMNSGELKNKYKDFEIHSDFNNIFYWESTTKTGHFPDDIFEQITVAATPFWEWEEYTPVDLEWFTLLNNDGNNVIEMEGEGSFYKALKHQTNFENVDELLNWYEEFYLPTVYDTIMNTLLPKMHKLVDYELKIKQKG